MWACGYVQQLHQFYCNRMEIWWDRGDVIIARNASHFTAKRASSAFVTIERLSHKDQPPWPPPRLIRAAAMICTGRPSQTRRSSEVEFAPVGKFFPFLFSWLLHGGSCRRFTSGNHITVYFLVCLCLRVWMVGMFANWTICLSHFYYY